VRLALEAGPGVDVWRGGPFAGDDGWSLHYEFKLVKRGERPELRLPGVMFVQPELTEGERIRLLDNRHDWREDRWEDYCGVPDCGHSSCEGHFL